MTSSATSHNDPTAAGRGEITRWIYSKMENQFCFPYFQFAQELVLETSQPANKSKLEQAIYFYFSTDKYVVLKEIGLNTMSELIIIFVLQQIFAHAWITQEILCVRD